MRLPKKKAVKAAVAGLAASAMLLTAMPAYAGIGSGGGGVHGDPNIGRSDGLPAGRLRINFQGRSTNSGGRAFPVSGRFGVCGKLVDMVHRLPVRAMVGLDSDGLPSAGRAVGRERGMHPTPSETINDVRRNQ